jgi:hypothetical protein
VSDTFENVGFENLKKDIAVRGSDDGENAEGTFASEDDVSKFVHLEEYS